jgi:hypothetical protein
MKYFTIILFLFVTASTFAQTGIGTTTPHASAQLEVSSTTKGFLPPRLTTEQRDAIVNPADGLIIYNTTTNILEYKTASGWVSLISNPNGVNSGEMQYWDGSAWVVIPSSTNDGATLTVVGGIPTWVDGTQLVPSVTNPTTFRTWMDRNLGASQVAISSTDTDAYGDLYQWGRGADGHQLRTSGTTTVLSSSTSPGTTFITGSNDWYTGTENLWQGVNGINNPCPNGYRLPTEAEWEAERATWSSNDAAGAFASPLKLPMAGIRLYDGSFFAVGSFGFYWSSTKIIDSSESRMLRFRRTHSDASMLPFHRVLGLSVRCLKD